MIRLRRIPSSRALAAVLPVVSLAACSIFGPDDRLDDELAGARARWASVGPDSYTFTLQRICFCLPESSGPARVTVIDGAVSGVVYAESGEPVPEQYAYGFPSVGGLFDVIEEALEQDAARVDVTYDPETGVPIDIFIDYHEGVADEELGFSASIPTPMD